MIRTVYVELTLLFLRHLSQFHVMYVMSFSVMYQNRVSAKTLISAVVLVTHR